VAEWVWRVALQTEIKGRLALLTPKGKLRDETAVKPGLKKGTKVKKGYGRLKQGEAEVGRAG